MNWRRGASGICNMLCTLRKGLDMDSRGEGGTRHGSSIECRRRKSYYGPGPASKRDSGEQDREKFAVRCAVKSRIFQRKHSEAG